MRLRLFLAFLLIVLVTTTAMLALSSVRLQQEISQFISRGGLSGNDALVEELEAFYVEQGSWQGVNAVMERQRGGTGGGPPAGQPALLADAAGKVLMGTGGPGTGGGAGGGFGPGGQGTGAGQQETAAADRIGATLTSAERETAIPLYAGDELVGYLLPETTIPFGALIEENLLARLNRAALIAAAIAASLSLILALLLAYALLRPIRELTRAASAMGRGDLNQRVRPGGGRETALLARTFNQMADSLQRAESRRKSLTADIAHELRNPLAIQRANLEALQDGLYPLTPENLEPVVRQNRQLEHLVDDLRTLALADSGHLPLERTPTDLAALLTRRIDDLAADALARSITIEADLAPGCPPLSLDAGRIGQVFNNLMSNALRHTPPGGRVQVRLHCTGRSAVVTVRDTGPGIPPEELDDIFERFFRGDRSRANTDGSTGLGLSIARRLAEAHGGALQAANHPDGGAVFTLTLPIAP